jgi:pilus assembly protein CpaE
LANPQRNPVVRSVLDAPAPIERTTAVRLPVARPPFLAFVTDGETEALLHECVAQLGRGKGTITRGGITKAVAYLGQHRSPGILIVDISGVELPISKVNELADVCEPGVAVIAIGNRDEIGLYRDLLQAGVTEYVVKPVNPQLLAKAITSGRARTGEGNPIHKKRGTLVAFVGARGGVGTTTLAVNMAWYLANRQTRRVALVDLDLQNGDCALALEIKPTPGLSEALANPLRIDNTLLERVMSPVGERLFVLSSEEPLNEDLHFTGVAVETLVSVLREQFHYVILDVPRIPAAPYRRALEMADFRVVVADQTLRSVRDVVRLRTALGEGDGNRRNLVVVNRYGEGGRHAVTLQEMQHVLEVKPKSIIPFQPTLFTSPAGSTKIPASRRGKFADAISALAIGLSGRPPKRRRWWRSEK